MASVLLDSTNGGFNGVTTDFFTLDLAGGEVVRRYWTALQGGYVIPDSKHAEGGSSVSDKNYYSLLSLSFFDIADNADLAFGRNGSSDGVVTKYEQYTPYYYFDYTTTVFFGSEVTPRGYTLTRKTATGYATSCYLSDVWQSGDHILQKTGGHFEYKGAKFYIECRNLYKDIGINYFVYTTSDDKYAYPLLGREDKEEVRFAASAERQEKGRDNIPKARTLFIIPSIYFVDNIEGFSDDQIFKKIRLEGKIKEIKRASEALDETNGIKELRKNIIVMIKNDDRLKIVFYAMGLCGAETKIKELNYPWGSHDFIFFTAMDVWGVVDAQSEYKKVDYGFDEDFFLIATPDITPDMLCQGVEIGGVYHQYQHGVDILWGFMPYAYKEAGGKYNVPVLTQTINSVKKDDPSVRLFIQKSMNYPEIPLRDLVEKE